MHAIDARDPAALERVGLLGQHPWLALSPQIPEAQRAGWTD